MYTRLITRIETTCSRLGKDDKFQLFICLAVHDRLLGRIVTDLTKAVAAQQVHLSKYLFLTLESIFLSIILQLYEDHAFFRDPTLVTFLSHILYVKPCLTIFNCLNALAFFYISIKTFK